MKSKHQRTLEAIFSVPTQSNIRFSDLESLIKTLGGDVREGAGSRVVFELNDKREYFHRPHPGKEAKRYQVEVLRNFLVSMEIKP